MKDIVGTETTIKETKQKSVKDTVGTETAIKETKQMSVKVIIGIGFGCMTAFIFFLFLVFYLRRRNNRLKQVVKDEVTPLRYLEFLKTNIQLIAED